VTLKKIERSGLIHNNNSSEQDQRTGSFRKLASSVKIFRTSESTVILFCKFSKIWKRAFFDFPKKKKKPRTGDSNKIKELPNTGINYRPYGNRDDQRSVPIGLPGYAAMPSKAWVFQALFFQIMLHLNSTIIINPIPPEVNLLMYC
jgi:hypothetical protein